MDSRLRGNDCGYFGTVYLIFFEPYFLGGMKVSQAEYGVCLCY